MDTAGHVLHECSCNLPISQVPPESGTARKFTVYLCETTTPLEFSVKNRGLPNLTPCPPAAHLSLKPHALGFHTFLTRGGLKSRLCEQEMRFVLAEAAGPVPVLGGIVSGASMAVVARLLAEPNLAQHERAVEIGAGRGLVGLGIGHLGVPVTMTDIEADVCTALRTSVEATLGLNAISGLVDVPGSHVGSERLKATSPVEGHQPIRCGKLEVRQLDWDDGLSSLDLDAGPGVLLGADLLWSADAVDSLWEAVAPAVLDHGWHFLYGASLRPSNAIFLQRLSNHPECELTSQGLLVLQVCECCRGWHTAEECVVVEWRRARSQSE